MIHKFCKNNNYIVLDIPSGTVLSVDKLVFDLLDTVSPPLNDSPDKSLIEQFLDEYSIDEIIEAYNEIISLVNEGYLFTEDIDEDYSDLMKDSPIKAMCLNISHDCNMRCDYCFASKGDYNGPRGLMSLDTAKAAIDFLIKSSGSRHNLEVDFFGGEPLMAYNTIKGTIEYARSLEPVYDKRFRFTVTTNGVLLNDEIIDFINQEMSNVVLSIDGRKEVNDRMRHLATGEGSFDTIMPKFKKLINNRKSGDWYVRGTYTKYNLDFASDVEALADMGFSQISIEPVITDPSEPYCLTESDLPEIAREYDRLAEIMINRKREGKGFVFFHFMLDLSQGPCIIKRLRGCGCGNEYVAVTPDGSIYPCHQFADQPEWVMGSVYKGIEREDLKKSFALSSVLHKKKCNNCWAKYYCSGGCNANNWTFGRDILEPYGLSCEIEKIRLEDAIYIASCTEL